MIKKNPRNSQYFRGLSSKSFQIYRCISYVGKRDEETADNKFTHFQGKNAVKICEKIHGQIISIEFQGIFYGGYEANPIPCFIQRSVNSWQSQPGQGELSRDIKYLMMSPWQQTPSWILRSAPHVPPFGVASTPIRPTVGESAPLQYQTSFSVRSLLRAASISRLNLSSRSRSRLE